MNQSDYEQFLVHINFTEPYYLRDAIAGTGVDDGGLGILSKDDDVVEILDFGCGTGIVGHLLSKEAGFSTNNNKINIWGLDASESFVDMINTNNGIYQGGEVLFLGRGVDKFPSKHKNKYDLVTGTGVFLAKHIPAAAFEDAHAALKIGGVFCFTLRANLWIDNHHLQYKDTINQLVNEGKMQYLDRVTKTFWRGREEGIGLFERQQSKLFALQKLK